jgi:hypothetical protein
MNDACLIAVAVVEERREENACLSLLSLMDNDVPSEVGVGVRVWKHLPQPRVISRSGEWVHLFGSLSMLSCWFEYSIETTERTKRSFFPLWDTRESHSWTALCAVPPALDRLLSQHDLKRSLVQPSRLR